MPIQQWNTSVKNNFDYKHRMEPHVFHPEDKKKRIKLSTFRCAALIITEARKNSTVVKDKHCPLCNNQENVHEYHFLLVCAELQDFRAKYLSKCYEQSLELEQLMNLISTVRITQYAL